MPLVYKGFIKPGDPRLNEVTIFCPVPPKIADLMRKAEAAKSKPNPDPKRKDGP